MQQMTLKANRTVTDGITFDSALESRCYKTIKSAVAELGLDYMVKCHVPIKIKPQTVLYPQIDLAVDVMLDPNKGSQTRLRPLLIEVKSDFTIKKSDFVLRVKMMELWNKPDYNNLVLMGENPMTSGLKCPIITRDKFASWLWYNHKVV